MNKGSHEYVAKIPDDHGIIHYSEQENFTWHTLITRQRKLIEKRACTEFLDALATLALPEDHVPQLSEVSHVLHRTTGWTVERVPALISFEHFFDLLAHKKFPVATFIRDWEELDYLQEPDIFHEIFGHCPLLTNPHFAEFTHTYGKLGLAASKEDRIFLARLYWFTIEFGLLKTPAGLRIYGGGILSSKGESVYCLDDPRPERLVFNMMTVLRTPYRIDIMQPVYFVLDDLVDLYHIAQADIMAAVREAKLLGLLPAKFA